MGMRPSPFFGRQMSLCWSVQGSGQKPCPKKVRVEIDRLGRATGEAASGQTAVQLR